MKRICCSAFFCVIITNKLLSQGFCLTPDTFPNVLQQLQLSGVPLQTPSSPYVIRTYVHLIRRSNGTGGLSYQDVAQVLNTLVSDFEPHGICFSFSGITEIFSDVYYYHCFNDTIFPLLVNTHRFSNALNIYLGGPDSPWGGKGGGHTGASMCYSGNIVLHYLPPFPCCFPRGWALPRIISYFSWHVW